MDQVFFKLKNVEQPSIPRGQSLLTMPADAELICRVKSNMARCPGPTDKREANKAIADLKQERCKKMLAVEREYRQRLQVLESQNNSTLGVEKDRPSVAGVRERIEEKAQVGAQKLTETDKQYRTKLQETKAAQHEQMQKLLCERAAAEAQFNANRKAADDKRAAEWQQMRKESSDLIKRLNHLGPSGVPKRPAGSVKSASAANFYPASVPPPALFSTQAPQPSPSEVLKESIVREKAYWQWAKTMRKTIKPTSDQSWAKQKMEPDEESDEDEDEEEEEQEEDSALPKTGAHFAGTSPDSSVNSASSSPRPTSCPAMTRSKLPLCPWNDKTHFQQREAAYASSLKVIREKIIVDTNVKDNRHKELATTIKAKGKEHQNFLKSIPGKNKERPLMLGDFAALAERKLAAPSLPVLAATPTTEDTGGAEAGTSSDTLPPLAPDSTAS